MRQSGAAPEATRSVVVFVPGARERRRSARFHSSADIVESRALAGRTTVSTVSPSVDSVSRSGGRGRPIDVPHVADPVTKHSSQVSKRNKYPGTAHARDDIVLKIID